MEKTVLYRIQNEKYDTNPTVLMGPEGRDLHALQKVFNTRYDLPLFTNAVAWTKFTAGELREALVAAQQAMCKDRLVIRGTSSTEFFNGFIQWLIRDNNFNHIQPIEYIYQH